jgi:hypothetical protein
MAMFHQISHCDGPKYNNNTDCNIHGLTRPVYMNGAWNLSLPALMPRFC